MKKVLLVVAALALATSTGAFAATNAVNTNTVAPTLNVTANVQSAVSLTLSAGTSAAPTHCVVTPGAGSPDYTMDFGTVDALGINNGNCNKIAPATPGTSNAIYWSDYTITPVYTSQASISNTTVTAQVTTDFATSNVFVVRSATATSSTVPAVATDFAAMGTGSADTIGAAGVASGTALTRFIGIAVKPTNAATDAGAKTATVTFTLTVN